MFPIAIIVYSCLATATFDDFDPHQVNAAAGYVARHPGICRQESPLILEADVSLEECALRFSRHMPIGRFQAMTKPFKQCLPSQGRALQSRSRAWGSNPMLTRPTASTPRPARVAKLSLGECMALPPELQTPRALGEIGAKSREIRSGVEPLPWATGFEGSNPTLSATIFEIHLILQLLMT
jgi:hypothetical protein